MKPRTKLQVRVTELSSSLPNIENKMLDWAKVDCLEHKGYATKSRVICMDCGKRFSPELVNRKRAICPHCGIKLKVEQSEMQD
ncbi:endonuclease Q family protein [Bacteroides sp. BFG-551]|nr:endonuclease Q family protein [Bacteroides sp. BFG-551]